MFDYELAVIILMLILNAILTAYEMGLASISRARISILVNERKKGAAEAAFMKDRIEASLAVIQLGITLFTTIAAAAGGVGAQAAFAPYLAQTWHISMTLAKVTAVAFVIIPLTLVTIIFVELVPKMFALNNKEWIVLRLSPIMKVLAKIIDPFVSVIEIVVKKLVAAIARMQPETRDSQTPWLHELRAAVSLARTSKLMGEREEKIVLAAAHLSTHLVRDIMIPARDISTIYVGNTLAQALVKAHLDMHTRFPVCMVENDPQSIQRYVNFKDIVSALRINPSDPTIRGISRPITTVQEDLPLSKLLEMMIQSKTHIVIVVSHEGIALGMVTLEDIIEELVGEIEDEFDRLPIHISPSGTGWIMGGGVPMTTVASTAGLDWSAKFTGPVPVLAEWPAKILGRPLQAGETFEADNLRILPRKFRRKKLYEAIVYAVSSETSGATI
ncbi:MAG: CNNM domain-containing protein [Sedimentisphaerales bacterium]|jgi:putative hemolysin